MKSTWHILGSAVAAILLVGVTACGPRKKEVSELQRKQAAHLVSEAEFAVTLRDWARAEALLLKAAELTPDTGAYWLSLGTTRMRLSNRAGAKQAYEQALRAFEDEAKAAKQDPEPILRQVYVLALLGRVEDGRQLLDKTTKRFPDNRAVRAFVEAKQLDKLIAQPDFKQVAL